MQPRGETWITRGSGHTTIEGRSGSTREILIHRKVTAIITFVVSLTVWEAGVVQVVELVAIVQHAQISLFPDDLSVLVTTMTGMLLHLNVIRFDAAVRVRMVLSCVEHGVSILHHECLLRLRITSLIRVPRPVSIDSGRLPHDKVDNTATVDDSTDLLLSLSEKHLSASSLHAFSDLALSEFLICLISSGAKITIEHQCNAF